MQIFWKRIILQIFWRKIILQIFLKKNNLHKSVVVWEFRNIYIYIVCVKKIIAECLQFQITTFFLSFCKVNFNLGRYNHVYNIKTLDQFRLSASIAVERFFHSRLTEGNLNGLIFTQNRVEERINFYWQKEP